jgi:predicted RNA-binding Zn-ribbon protein involved in translation (DUF1610 family)
MASGLGDLHRRDRFNVPTVVYLELKRKVKNNGRLVDHVRTLWQRKFDCNVSYRTRLLFLVLHERIRTGGHSMKCQKCGHEMNFREDAWPQEIKPGSWVELWICPKCGEEIVN